MTSDWRQRNKQALRAQLYETALTLFDSQGYEATSVRQITEAVGVAKGTFFNHFPTKEHVVAAWYNELTESALTDARARPLVDAETAVADLFGDMARRAQASPALLIAKSRHGANPLLVAAEAHQDDETDRFVLEVCEAAKARGELADHVEPAFFVGILGDLLTGTSRAWVAAHPPFDFEAVVRERIAFLFHAARQPKS